ncbi:unnamed protein product [Adineta ricciae]|uniref:RRM domain-containing protein n=1 Tax=Adineta ricciae TaxID=249248 RepID=A0A813V279_ADIRI|nr:unnamed protein product [Adineta ricciae]
MPAYIDQSFEQFRNQIQIDNLPTNINVEQITNLFDRFGMILSANLKHRRSRNSSVILSQPFIILIFDKRESIDEIMSHRPYFLDDYQLFVHRCLPITRRYPYESQTTTNKILLRIPHENHQDILPKDHLIREYLNTISSQITRFDRFDEKNVLIEFDDYDQVDIFCLSRPHWIDNQLIEIEKCYNEQLARRRAQYQQKSVFFHFLLLLHFSHQFRARPITAKLSFNENRDTPSNQFISPTLTLNVDEHAAQLRLKYSDRTNQLETEHERTIGVLKIQWKNMAKERIRLQRLTLDNLFEYERLIEENHRWKKLFNENLHDQARLRQINTKRSL